MRADYICQTYNKWIKNTEKKILLTNKTTYVHVQCPLNCWWTTYSVTFYGRRIIVFLTSPRHFKIKTLDLNKTSLSLESFSGSAMIVWLISFYCSGNTGDALGDTWDWVLSVVLQSSRRDSRDHRPHQLRHQLHPLLSHVLPVQENREEDAWSGQDSLHHHTINWCQENVKF